VPVRTGSNPRVQERIDMGCIFAAFMSLFPRFAFLIVWVARPKLVDAAFDTFLIPFVGVMLLPFTTLMYVILYQPGGLEGSDWIWIALAALCDLAHTGGTYVQREQITQDYSMPWVKG
jgi:hypothetical protein